VKVLDVLREEKELDWTFLSPSYLFAPGERTGKFRLGKDELLVGADGQSRIYRSPHLLVSIENPYISSLAEYDPIPTRILRFV
jgi:uncharacterized protein